MKKSFIIVICLSVVLSFSLCACGSSNENSNADFSDESSNPVELGETYEYMGTSIVLPKGFTVDEKKLIAQPAELLDDNISMSFEKHSKVSAIDENELLELMKTSEKEMFSTLEKFDEFKKFTLDGHDALIIRYKIVYEGDNLSIIQYSVDTSDGVVTYCFKSISGIFDNAFEESISHIKVSEAD